MTPPVVIAIQARLGGTRLPGKVTKMVGSRMMIGHVLHRAESTGYPTRVLWAENFSHIPEWDVLHRFHEGLKDVEQETLIVRLTADCPLVDSGFIKDMVARVQADNLLFFATSPEWDGTDVEVFTYWALHVAHTFVAPPDRYRREHVTARLREYWPKNILPNPGPSLRWSVDDLEGLEFVRAVMGVCKYCEDGIPHHSNAQGSVGGLDRYPVWDLHMLDHGGLAECTAYDILKTRMGGPVYESK